MRQQLTKEHQMQNKALNIVVLSAVVIFAARVFLNF
jgi:hypothetical protein